jgi:hypothetical protein
MTANFICGSLILCFLFIITSCGQLLNEDEKITTKIMDRYTEKYGFSSEALYDPIFDESYGDTLHRCYWELDKSEVEDYLDKFTIFDTESLLAGRERINYVAFGVVFTREGHILSEGFLDEYHSFTGKSNLYDEKWRLVEKHYSKLDHLFYKVVYKTDDNGAIIDSTYQYYVIVIPDKDTFEGPDLNICFDIQIIIDTIKYDYEDFLMYYALFDSRDTGDTQEMIDNETIYQGPFKSSTDGHYHICHDLQLKYHLVMSFGIFVDEEVSEQDLTWGIIFGPIINKNIDSTDL